jgi:hypothetical protein
LGTPADIFENYQHAKRGAFFKYLLKMFLVFLPSAPTPRPEDQPLALSEHGILALRLCNMPCEFASGLTAEGQGKRHNIWREAPTTSPWGTK